MARLEKAIRVGDAALADRLHTRVGEFLDWTERLPSPVGIKEAVRQRKIKTGASASPLGEEAGRRRDAFLSWFEQWLPIVLKECR
jgi:dihydrodipicolinate synthase/N-acetylneuraminate lyase